MLAEIQVLPTPSGTPTSGYAYIDQAIAGLAADTGLRIEVGALGTTIEGAPDEVWAALRRAHDATLIAGADQVVTVIKVAECPTDPSRMSIDELTSAHRGSRA